MGEHGSNGVVLPASDFNKSENGVIRGTIHCLPLVGGPQFWWVADDSFVGDVPAALALTDVQARRLINRLTALLAAPAPDAADDASGGAGA